MKNLFTLCAALVISSVFANADWYLGLEAGPRVSILSGKDVENENVSPSRITGLGSGINAMAHIRNYFRISLGFVYDERGSIITGGVRGTDIQVYGETTFA